MGSRASTLLRDEELEEIKKETGFSHSQITRLYSRFTSLDKGENGTLSREDFQRIPELAINPLGDRIINAFFPEGEDQVNFRGFMRTLAHFRPIEDNEKSKDVNGPEPLNSRSNKLHSEPGKGSGLPVAFRLRWPAGEQGPACLVLFQGPLLTSPCQAGSGFQ
ncbi:calcineurin B homologous protein 1 isoform X3 [Manis pentadactyla]|uniref:calcineurin B homologous protein 1 isoform X3 n=1 Tax=Manis pentadactyla TaxID=143292 RepID=UPI001875A4B9|nr:calcineurin B homologous protein 1 isoform X3 [Manis pentadactyla]